MSVYKHLSGKRLTITQTEEAVTVSWELHFGCVCIIQGLFFLETLKWFLSLGFEYLLWTLLPLGRSEVAPFLTLQI